MNLIKQQIQLKYLLFLGGVLKMGDPQEQGFQYSILDDLGVPRGTVPGDTWRLSQTFDSDLGSASQQNGLSART